MLKSKKPNARKRLSEIEKRANVPESADEDEAISAIYSELGADGLEEVWRVGSNILYRNSSVDGVYEYLDEIGEAL